MLIKKLRNIVLTTAYIYMESDMYRVVIVTEIGVYKSYENHKEEKRRYTGTREYHMDANITCKGKGWNGEVHRMKRIGVMR